jgi:hypothetical protein
VSDNPFVHPTFAQPLVQQRDFHQQPAPFVDVQRVGAQRGELRGRNIARSLSTARYRVKLRQDASGRSALGIWRRLRSGRGEARARFAGT